MSAGNIELKKLTNKIPKTFESEPHKYPQFLFAGIKINKNQTVYILEKHD